MNIQAMMKQAQKLQGDMMKTQKEINEKEFEITNNFVTIKANGSKKLNSIKINLESIDKDEIEMLEDVITVAINELFEKIDKEVESKMGKYTNGLPGLF